MSAVSVILRSGLCFVGKASSGPCQLSLVVMDARVALQQRLHLTLLWSSTGLEKVRRLSPRQHQSGCYLTSDWCAIVSVTDRRHMA